MSTEPGGDFQGGGTEQSTSGLPVVGIIPRSAGGRPAQSSLVSTLLDWPREQSLLPFSPHHHVGMFEEPG